jgi:hypothetical protein
MDLLGTTGPEIFSAGGLFELVFEIIRILAYVALGIVVSGAVMTLCCDFFGFGRDRPRPRDLGPGRTMIHPHG